MKHLQYSNQLNGRIRSDLGSSTCEEINTGVWKYIVDSMWHGVRFPLSQVEHQLKLGMFWQ